MVVWEVVLVVEDPNLGLEGWHDIKWARGSNIHYGKSTPRPMAGRPAGRAYRTKKSHSRESRAYMRKFSAAKRASCTKGLKDPLTAECVNNRKKMSIYLIILDLYCVNFGIFGRQLKNCSKSNFYSNSSRTTH